MGEIVKIQNFSSVEPPAAQPTAAPTQPGTAPTQGPAPTATSSGGVIGAPDTGTGASGESSSLWLVLSAMALGGAAIALGGARVAPGRR